MTETARNHETLQYAREGTVAIVSLNNPPMNVITRKLAQETIALLDEIAADSSIRAVLMRSAVPGVFAAGGDITVLREIEEITDEWLQAFKAVRPMFDKLAQLPQPTVAALGGTTLGGGFELALACDFRFMADGSGELGLPEVRLGILPGGGGTQRLPRIVGAAKATEMIIKGMRYKPAQAKQLGLVLDVVSAEELDTKAMQYAQSLAAQAPLAVQCIKRLIRAAFETPGAAGLELERELFLKTLQSKDAKEGMRAFFEGRKAEFTGS